MSIIEQITNIARFSHVPRSPIPDLRSAVHFYFRPTKLSGPPARRPCLPCEAFGEAWCQQAEEFRQIGRKLSGRPPRSTALCRQAEEFRPAARRLSGRPPPLDGLVPSSGRIQPNRTQTKTDKRPYCAKEAPCSTLAHFGRCSGFRLLPKQKQNPLVRRH